MARPVESNVTGPSVPTVIDHELPLYFASDETLAEERTAKRVSKPFAPAASG